MPRRPSRPLPTQLPTSSRCPCPAASGSKTEVLLAARWAAADDNDRMTCWPWPAHCPRSALPPGSGGLLKIRWPMPLSAPFRHGGRVSAGGGIGTAERGQGRALARILAEGADRGRIPAGGCKRRRTWFQRPARGSFPNAGLAARAVCRRRLAAAQLQHRGPAASPGGSNCRRNGCG